MKKAFIGCMPRSGSSLLRVILDSHPSIQAGPEFKWMDKKKPKKALIDHIKQCSKEYYVNKTPKNLSVPALSLLQELYGGDFKFIHIIRNPRDVACSYIKSIEPYEFAEQEFLKDARIFMKGMDELKHVSHLTINYELLVNYTRAAVDVLCSYLEIPYDNRMLNHHKFKHNIVDHHSDRNAIKPIFNNSIGQYTKYKISHPMNKIIEQMLDKYLIEYQ